MSPRFLLTLFVPLFCLHLPLGAIHANTNCKIEQLAGSYKSAFGDMQCEAAGKLLTCCYEDVSSCNKKLELKLSSRGNALTGKWVEHNRQNGPARFAVSQDCSVDDGFWGAGRRATSPWSVQRVAQAEKSPAPTKPATASRAATTRAKTTREQRPSTKSQTDHAIGMRIENALAALGYDTGPVDGVVDDKTNVAIRAWQRKTGHSMSRGLTMRQLDTMERSAAAAKAQAEQLARLEAQGPLARFNRRIERNDVTVLLDTKPHCEETGKPLAILAEDEHSIPESGRVLGALQNALSYTPAACRRSWRRFDVPVYTPSGELLSESYMYMFKAQPALILPYSILSADYLDFLNSDPGYPFARVAPPLINIASGLWEREFTRGGWSQSMGGTAHWQTIAFQFALADAQSCKSQVGETVTYKHTITQQDEYGATIDSTTVEYEFDADWEPIILRILENGNHIGRPMGTGARRLISTYGCDSEEVARLRRNPITVVANALDMPLPPGAGHVQH